MGEVNYAVITPNIKKQILKEGKQGGRPSIKWICTVNLIIHSAIDDENFKSGMMEITMGDGASEYERLLERCLETMHLEEDSLFLLKLSSKNIDISLQITLNSAIEKPPVFLWTDEEKLKESNYFKNIGTNLFNENRIEDAFYKFSSALKLLLTLDSILEEEYCSDEEVNKLRVALYNNLARCQLHYKNYLYVVELCSSSIKIDCSVKALYRRALAYIELKEYECAENDLVQLLKLEPRNKAGIEKFKEVRELDRCNRESYHSVVKKMFQ